MTQINNNLGRIIDDHLSGPSDRDAITSGLVVSGNHLDRADKLVAEAFALGGDETSRKAFYKKVTGQEFDKDKEALPDVSALRQLAMHQYEKAQQVMATLQRLRTQAHEMIMQIIRTIGRQ